MSIQIETTFGDIVIDLDTSGSPTLCKNILKLCKARYYTNTLMYNIVPGKYCQLGDPRGDGSGGCSIFGLLDATTTQTAGSTIDVTKSQRRFLRSTGRLLSKSELGRRGTVVAMEMGHVPDTIGSQFLITLGNSGDNGFLGVDSVNDNINRSNSDDGATATTKYLSLGKVVEDQNGVLAKLDRSYCDDDGRPYADIRIVRALVISDPYDDPDGMDDLLVTRGVSMDDAPRNLNCKTTNNDDEEDLVEGCPLALYSPIYDRPLEEIVPTRIAADDTTLFATAGWDDDIVNNHDYDDDDNEDEVAKQARLDLQNKQDEEWRKRQDTSRAVVLEMLGDRPTANVEAPDNVLFVCKLNPYTTDEDLELIFARFDSSATAEIVRDPDTGTSLQYAFVEFTSSEACNEAYLKMNNALVDDRRIKVDFSQSVAKVWDRYNKRYRKGDRSGGIDRGYVDGGGRGNGKGRGGRGGGDGRGHLVRGRGHVGGGNSSASRNSNSLRDDGPSSQAHHHRTNQPMVDRRPPDNDRNERRMEKVDDFGMMTWPTMNETRRDCPYSSNRNDGNNSCHRLSRDDSQSQGSSRDTVEEKRKRRRIENNNRHRDHSKRGTRSRSGSRSLSPDSGIRQKKKEKHRKHHHHSHEREKKQHKIRHHHHRRRDGDYSDDEEDERQRKMKHHRSERR